MRLPVKDMDIATGSVRVVILNQQDAARMDLHANDRLFLRKGGRKAIAILDVAESEKAVPPGRIGLFEEVLDALNAKHNDIVDFILARKPESIDSIKLKMDGKELTPSQINGIVKDIVHSNLTDVELTSFVTANYIHGMTMNEVVSLTKSMAYSGLHLSLRRRPIMDVHSIGGVPGNRTTPIVVPIVAAAGLTIPKTSSRAITSPAGTADALEVLTNVILPKEKLERLAYQLGGFMVWGGAISLAPADDKIIAVEHPLNIDAEGQMLASIMAKKASVGATHLLLEIPIDRNGKVRDERRALHLKNAFCTLGNKLGIDVHVLVTDGSQPIGNGIGPALEARDVIWVLTDDRRGPQDLREKSLIMAGKLLEMGNCCKRGEGYATAERILDSGEAYAKFIEIIKAQGGPRIVKADAVPLSAHTFIVRAPRNGTITNMDNKALASIAKAAGAPSDHGSGIFLHKHRSENVRRGEPLYTIHAGSRDELRYATSAARAFNGVSIR
ncbi:AMP phosphorylase [Candidatus Woesearchaeota archaeon]|nr:AMP phosphorylase [Candidatus Woesearchaeota archaeon]